jgi:ethanolamine permease
MEGLANVAEETIHPQKNITKGFAYSMATLGVLAVLTFCAAVGVGGWEKVVYNAAGETSDSPLPMALAQVSGDGSVFYHMLVSIGLFGFVASFNGLLLAAGRASFEFGRSGHFPALLGKLHPRFNTPHIALIVNMLIGIAILFTGKTGEIITIAVFGALTMYIFSCFSLLKLRKKSPDLERPFKVPFFPFTPYIALVIALISFVAMCFIYPLLAAIYVGVIAFAFLVTTIFQFKK